MSRFFSKKYASLTPYTPGEQPKDAQYIKLNTNESPFPPPISVLVAAEKEAANAHLYSDPESAKLTEKTAEILGVKKTQVLMTNGSDEALNFAFMAFCDKTRGIVFPDITYGFYPVFAKLNGVPYRTIPLTQDFKVNYRDYMGICENIVIANPNAPTGIALTRAEVEEIVTSNPDNVVIIDEAYVDFGGESCVPLIGKYDNLLITQTFSKSRSLAGARLGFAVGNEQLIADLNTVKYSTNPYNVNRMTAAAGYAALCEEKWFAQNCQAIARNREFVSQGLRALGFTVLDSKTNFVFAKSEKLGGKTLYERLKASGILVRWFNVKRIEDFVRITIGTREQMQALLDTIEKITKENV